MNADLRRQKRKQIYRRLRCSQTRVKTRVVGDVAADFIRVNLRASAVCVCVLWDLFSLRSGRRFDHDHGWTDWFYLGEVEPGLLNQSSVFV